MNAKLQAAQDLQRFAGMFRNFVALADDLVDVGSLEQARDAAQAELVKINQAAAETSLASAQKLQEANAQLHYFKQEAERAVTLAKEQAKEIVDKAAKAAGEMLGLAHKEAKDLKAEARQEADVLKREVAELQVSIDLLKVAQADHKRDLEDAKKEHARIALLIADLKAKFS